MNNATFTGRIGRDAESRATPSGKQVVNFSLAVDERRGGEKSTLWVSCAIWGERGEKLAQYLTKGQQVTVIGTVSEREFTDKEGNKRKSMDVRVNDIALQGGKRDEGDRQPSRAARQPQRSAAPAGGGGFEGMDDMDDVPF